jgi:Phosphoenolpyruvate carboxylase
MKLSVPVTVLVLAGTTPAPVVSSLGWKQHTFLSRTGSFWLKSNDNDKNNNNISQRRRQHQQQQQHEKGRLSSFIAQRRGGGGSNVSRKASETLDNIVAAPLTQSAGIDENREAPLMRDIDILSDILSDLVNRENPKVHDLYEEFRRLGTDRANDPDNVQALNKMIKRASQLSTDDAIGVIRTFSVMLNLANSAEVHHRTRVTKQFHLLSSSTTEEPSSTSYNSTAVEVGPLPKLDDSMSGTLDALLKSGQYTSKQIYDQLVRQKVEIVITAHPTQVQRKSLLRKYRKVSDTLALLDRTDLIAYERYAAVNELRRIISTIWGADEIRRTKPTPQKEAAGGNAIIENVLWDAVPNYLRKLDIECRLRLGQPLPIESSPIKFTSWIGGDRDGTYLPFSFLFFVEFHFSSAIFQTCFLF